MVKLGYMLLCLGLVLVTVGCSVDKNYVINGNVPKQFDGERVLLISREDTIAESQVIEEGFTMKGVIQNPQYTYLIVGDHKSPQFWVDNTTISATLDIDTSSKWYIQAGESQALQDSIRCIDDNYYTAMRAINGLYESDTVTKSQMHSLDSLKDIHNGLLQAFVMNNSGSNVALRLLNRMKEQWGKKETSDLLAVIDNTSIDPEYIKSINQYLELFADLQIGDKFIDVVMSDEKGNESKISENLGTYTLLEFWASWCIPCREGFPHLKRIHKEFGDKGFQVIAISIDDSEEKWHKAIKEDTLSWVNLLDANDQAKNIYGISFVPMTFMLDSTGTIIRVEGGLESFLSETLIDE